MASDLCVIYTRTSDPNADLKYKRSFAQQEAVCQQAAAERGYTVFRVVREAMTGTEWDRPVLESAIEDVKHGRATVILASEFDRYGRDDQLGYYAYRVEDKHGGRLESATEVMDKSDTAKIARQALSMAAKIEKDNATRRMARGKRDRAAQGKLMPGPHAKYGYVYADDEPGKRTRYIIDDVTGKVVQRMYALAAGGLSGRAIARILNKEKVPTPAMVAAGRKTTPPRSDGKHRRVGQVWHQEMVRRILADAAYAGKPEAFRQTLATKYVMRGGIKVKVRAMAPSEADGRVSLPTETWPAIVDETTWATVQQHISTNKENSIRRLADPHASLMRGHVYCGVCHKRMSLQKVAATGKKNAAYVYVCPGRPAGSTNTEKACSAGNQTIRASIVDREAWEAAKGLARFAHDNGQEFRYLLWKHLTDAALSADGPGLDGQLADLQAYMRQLEEKRASLTLGVSQTTNPAVIATLVQSMEAVADDIAATQKRLDDVTAKLEDRDFKYAWVDGVFERLQRVRPEGMDELSWEDKRFTLEMAGIAVHVWPAGTFGEGRTKVTHRFQVESDSLTLTSR